MEYRGGQVGPTTSHPPTYEIFTELKDGNALHLFGAESMDLGVATHMFHEMPQALDYLEAHQIIHRDIKPDNILFKCNSLKLKTDPDAYTFQLADFGMAKFVNNTSTYAGTPLYMAPEINPETNKQHYPQTPAADIWSLLVTMIFAMNKGRIREHSLNSHEEIIARVQEVATQHLPDLQQTLDRNPKFRPSAEALLDQHFQGRGKFPREKKTMLVENSNLACLHQKDDPTKKLDDGATGLRHNARGTGFRAQKLAEKPSTRQRQCPAEEMHGGVGRNLRARSVVEYTP